MLTNKFLQYRTNSWLKKNHTIRANGAYDKAENVGILFTIYDLKKHETVKEFIKTLKNDEKKVDVLAYLPKEGQNFEFRFDFFTEKDLNFWGSFTSEAVTKFVKKPFDYLFYLDDHNSEIVNNVMAMSNAKCRIGKLIDGNEKFCEMMVQSPNGKTSGLVKEMYKYTKLLS